jgi:phage shock protein A
LAYLAEAHPPKLSSTFNQQEEKTMALITRLSRLFNADVNAVLDQIEEPDLLLKQAIREMEDTLAHDEKQIKLLALEQQQHNQKQQELKQSLTDIDQQIALCFKSKKDDLARVLIKRKLEIEQLVATLTRKSSSSNDTLAQLKSQLKEHQSQFISMKQKAEIFSQNTSDNAANSTWDNHTFSVQDEDVEVAFLHEKQKWSES